jgi:hypothetical protein
MATKKHASPVLTKKWFRALVKEASIQRLLKCGFRKWDEKSGLYLIPHSLYHVIPNGFKVTSISGKKEAFKFGVSDDDQRFGCLAFGIVRKKPKSKKGAKAD